MVILLDECLPKDLRTLLPGHQVFHVTEKGWSGISNGKLLGLAQQNGFQGFITIDQNLAVQNPKTGTKLVIIVLKSSSNRISDLQPLAPRILDLLSKNPVVGVYPI